MQLDLTRYRQPLNEFAHIFQPEAVADEGRCVPGCGAK